MVSSYFNVPSSSKIDTSYFKSPVSKPVSSLPQSTVSSGSSKPQSVVPVTRTSSKNSSRSSGSSGSTSPQLSGGTYDVTTQTYTDSKGNKYSVPKEKVPSNATIIKSGSDPVIVPEPTPKPKVIVEDVYENVLDTKAYESYAVSKGSEFEAESKKVLEVKKKQLASLQNTERKRTLVKEKVIASTGSGGSSDVVGQGLAKKRTSSYELRQKKLTEKVNKELEEDFESRKREYVKDVEGAKSRFVRREKVGTKTRVIEYAPAEVSKESEVAGYFIGKGVTIYEAPKEDKIIEVNKIESKKAETTSDFNISKLLVKTEDFKLKPIDTKTSLQTPLSIVSSTKDSFQGASFVAPTSKEYFKDITSLKINETQSSIKEASSKLLSTDLSVPVSERIVASTKVIVKATELFSPYKDLGEGNLVGLVKIPSYVAGSAGVAVSSLIGLASKTSEFVGEKTVDYFDVKSGKTPLEKTLKLVGPEALVKVAELPFVGVKKGADFVPLVGSVVGFEVATGFSGSRSLVGNVVGGTVESVVTDPIKFGVESLVYSGFGRSVLGSGGVVSAESSAKALSKTSFLSVPKTVGFFEGDKLIASTSYKLNVGGFLGRNYEVVAKSVISKSELAKSLVDKGLLKLGKGVSSKLIGNRGKVVSSVSSSKVIISDSKDIVLSDDSLIKWVGEGFKEVNVSGKGASNLVGELVLSDVKGSVFVRPIGRVESIKSFLFPVKETGLVSSVVSAEKRVMSAKNVFTSNIDVELASLVSPRSLVDDAGRVVGVSVDGARLYSPSLSSPQKTGGLVELVKTSFSGFKQKVLGVDYSISGSKGKTGFAQYFGDESVLISPVKDFVSTELSFVTDKGKVVVSELKVDAMPRSLSVLSISKSGLSGVGEGFQKNGSSVVKKISENVKGLLSKPRELLGKGGDNLLTSVEKGSSVPSDSWVDKVLGANLTKVSGIVSKLPSVGLSEVGKGIGSLESKNLISVVSGAGSGLVMLSKQVISKSSKSNLVSSVKDKVLVDSKVKDLSRNIFAESSEGAFRSALRSEYASASNLNVDSSIYSKSDSMVRVIPKIGYSKKVSDKTITSFKDLSRLKDNVSYNTVTAFRLKSVQRVSERTDLRTPTKEISLVLPKQKIDTKIAPVVVPPYSSITRVSVRRVPRSDLVRKPIVGVSNSFRVRKVRPVFQLKADFFRRFVSAEKDIPFTKENVLLRKKLWSRLGSARAFIPTKELLTRGYINKIGLGSGRGLVL